MPKVVFITADGTTKEFEAPIGLSVLEVAHKNKIDLEGACEGSLACSTCHVIDLHSTFYFLSDCVGIPEAWHYTFGHHNRYEAYQIV